MTTQLRKAYGTWVVLSSKTITFVKTSFIARSQACLKPPPGGEKGQGTVFTSSDHSNIEYELNRLFRFSYFYQIQFHPVVLNFFLLSVFLLRWLLFIKRHTDVAK